MKKALLDIFYTLFDFFYYLKGKFVKKNCILIIPHATMCSVDYYDIINYKSDSALTFLHYLLENNLQTSKRILVAVADNRDINQYYKYVNDNYPNRKVSFVKFYITKHYKLKDKIKNRIDHNDGIIHSSHIFTSTTYELYKLVSKKQILCNVNYYTASMKNDIFEPDSPFFLDYSHTGREYTYMILPSELSIRLSVAEYGSVPYRKFKKLGLCRNDNLLNGDNCNWLREEISHKLSYKLKTLVLYTPTHRDYESKATSTESRSVLGFPYNEEDFGKFMRDNGIVIYCKLHPIQNAQVVNSNLPEGIILHHPSEKYGLNEMMQASDVLLTDYTSGYFDYLLLDKPVIFNLYDIIIYKETRGLPYDPYESVVAGDIIKNEGELKESLKSLERNREQYKEKRKFVRDMFFTYTDSNSCKRVYDFIFG